MAIMLEQILEGSTDSAFIFLTELGVFFQFRVIGFDRFMRRFDVDIQPLCFPCVGGIRNDTPLYTESDEIARRILPLSESGFMELNTLFWVLSLGKLFFQQLHDVIKTEVQKKFCVITVE